MMARKINRRATKSKGGRPPYEPDPKERAQVEKMAAYGIPQKDIARVVGVAYETLRKHFEQELDTGSTKATTKVAERLYQLAMDGNVAACIFWMKARAGWSDRVALEHTGVGGGPLTFTLKIGERDGDSDSIRPA